MEFAIIGAKILVLMHCFLFKNKQTKLIEIRLFNLCIHTGIISLINVIISNISKEIHYRLPC